MERSVEAREFVVGEMRRGGMRDRTDRRREEARRARAAMVAKDWRPECGSGELGQQELGAQGGTAAAAKELGDDGVQKFRLCKPNVHGRSEWWPLVAPTAGASLRSGIGRISEIHRIRISVEKVRVGY